MAELISFTDDPPWQLDLDQLVWAQGIDAIRTRERDRVPSLVTPRRVPPVLRLFEVVGRVLPGVVAWLVVGRHQGEAGRARLARRLRRAFEKLGPTYIKLGQIVSSGEGMIPAEVVKEFRLLRDRVPPEAFEAVRRTVEDDLGRPLEDVFVTFNQRPVASASIAQVHLARLMSGEEVAVKVQRPAIDRVFYRDLQVMAWLAKLLVGRIPVAALANPPALVELFAETVVEELDFRLEAQNMIDIAKVLDETGNEAIVVPRPHPVLVTRRVLVMERLDGFTFDDVDGMKAAGVDTSAVVRACMVSLLEGAMIFGVFHGDLHGGNLFVRSDGKVALLDYGITGRLTPTRRKAFLSLLLGSATDDPTIPLRALQEFGALPADADFPTLVEKLGMDRPPVDPLTMDASEIVTQMRDMTSSLLANGFRLPKELVLFMKDMMFLDGAMATLAPELNILSELTFLIDHFTTQHGARIAEEIGIDLNTLDIDLSDLETMMSAGADGFTYNDIQDRRLQMRSKMQEVRRLR